MEGQDIFAGQVGKSVVKFLGAYEALASSVAESFGTTGSSRRVNPDD